MKKFIVAALACVLCVSASQAGIKALGLDMVNTSFTANTGILSMAESGLAITITYDDNTPQGTMVDTGFNLNTKYISGMSFTGGTFAFTDSSSAVIISGSVLSVDFTSAGPYLVGDGTAQVLVSNLAGYPLGLSDIVSITFNLNPVFTGFDKDYTGDTKVNFLVPEPMTMLLLGLGAVLLRKVK